MEYLYILKNNYWIKLEKMWHKWKKCNLTVCPNVFKSCLLHLHQKTSVWGKKLKWYFHIFFLFFTLTVLLYKDNICLRVLPKQGKQQDHTKYPLRWISKNLLAFKSIPHIKIKSLLLALFYTWAVPWENQHYTLCVMYRPRSACAVSTGWSGPTHSVSGGIEV